ncbi:mitofusin-1 isoform X3 [Garra rufa]|uniref:mitofusin-1 isoform X3 n=1 Tax=Garra rufa TaxID=137080 RepID=UPI003CCEC89E
MEQDNVSPLQHFVVAKRTISAVFHQFLEFVKECSDFVEETWKSEDLEHVAEEKQCLQIQACSRKLTVIKDVLARRHMKVAFFGRTSNGKSTVINAMLRERVLPSGIGHTTNCFLSVEGTDGEHAYLTTDDSEERKSIETVNQLAHALHMDRNQDSGCLVRVFWPKAKCALLRDDLVLMDSPGTDVTSELDSWIDKFCLDADVFVLVTNSESTIMNTEKHFFHKVNERISKPNIFILNNRWDASVSEPEYLEDVWKQHMDRCVSFLVEELKVVDLNKAPDRIFFVSAKEVLSARIHCAQGMPETGGALAEGFQERLMEFQSFERTFEKLIAYVEERMVKNLDLRCSSSINGCVLSSQRDIMDTLRPLLPPAARGQLLFPSRKFSITYELNFASLCEDFVEDIEFQFSLGLTFLVNRFLGPAKAKQALSLLDQKLQLTSSCAPLGTQVPEEWAYSMATGLVSLTSRASVGMLVIAGVVWRSVGWRVIVLSVSLYSLLYLYERLTWTNSAKEWALKQQFVDYATQRLQAISHIISSDCGQQVQQEMVAVFARMCQQVDKSEMELETEIRTLSARIQRLESVQRHSKTLRHKATDLESQLESFSAQYLQTQY